MIALLKFPPPDLDAFDRHMWRSLDSWKRFSGSTAITDPDEKVLAEYEWPAVFQAEVEKYGAMEVWKVGEAALGIPPTWVEGPKHVRKVIEALEKKHGS